MNSLFHWHVTAWLAMHAGYDKGESHIIAAASSLADGAVLTLEVHQPGRPPYRCEPTHYYGPAHQGASTEAWMAFHFIPADPPRVWTVEPKSPLAKSILVAALKSGDLHRIGIALHSFADTWAHQGFSARNHDENTIGAANPLPSLGHAQAGRIPDQAGLSWVDPRPGQGLVHNGDRFLEAARFMFRYLAKSRGVALDTWESRLLPTLEPLLGTQGIWEASAPASDPLVRAGLVDARKTGLSDDDLEPLLEDLSGLPPWNSSTWYQEALVDSPALKLLWDAPSLGKKVLALGQDLMDRGKIPSALRVEAREGFWRSNLYRWYEAARLQKMMVQEFLAASSREV